MKGNRSLEVLEVLTRYPWTYPKHPNRLLRPYAVHLIFVPLGGVRQRQKVSREPGNGARTGLIVYSRSYMT